MKKDIDVLGYKLEDALEILYKNGIAKKIEITKPPVEKDLSNKLRVIRQKKIAQEKIELVLAAEVLRKEVPEDGF